MASPPRELRDDAMIDRPTKPQARGFVSPLGLSWHGAAPVDGGALRVLMLDQGLWPASGVLPRLADAPGQGKLLNSYGQTVYLSVMGMAPISVVESAEFLRQASRLFADDERTRLIDFVARNPLDGEIIEGTGGARKLRWAMAGRGKRGGARAIYYYHSATTPIVMFGVYSKTKQADLTAAQRTELKAVIAGIKAEIRKGGSA